MPLNTRTNEPNIRCGAYSWIRSKTSESKDEWRHNTMLLGCKFWAHNGDFGAKFWEVEKFRRFCFKLLPFCGINQGWAMVILVPIIGSSKKFIGLVSNHGPFVGSTRGGQGWFLCQLLGVWKVHRFGFKSRPFCGVDQGWDHLTVGVSRRIPVSALHIGCIFLYWNHCLRRFCGCGRGCCSGSGGSVSGCGLGGVWVGVLSGVWFRILVLVFVCFFRKKAKQIDGLFKFLVNSNPNKKYSLRG